jgi:hypothetical protein
MSRDPKTPPAEKPHPAWATAFARIEAAMAQATTPADYTEAEKTDLWILRPFGRPPQTLKHLCATAKSRGYPAKFGINSTNASIMASPAKPCCPGWRCPNLNMHTHLQIRDWREIWPCKYKN